MTVSDGLLVLFALMLLQVAGTYFQVKRYRQTVSKLHKLGNVGVGSNRKRFGAGNIVVIACQNDGTIIGAEEMRGFTIFTRFHPVEEIVGENIYELKIDYSTLKDEEKKYYAARLQAIEALEKRLAKNYGGEAETHEST